MQHITRNHTMQCDSSKTTPGFTSVTLNFFPVLFYADDKFTLFTNTAGFSAKYFIIALSKSLSAMSAILLNHTWTHFEPAIKIVAVYWWKSRVVSDWYRLSIPIDRLIGIGCRLTEPECFFTIFFWQIKSLFHWPIYRLQKTESVCIVPSQKNSGSRSCTFANNEIANNSSMSCCKIMNKAQYLAL